MKPVSGPATPRQLSSEMVFVYYECYPVIVGTHGKIQAPCSFQSSVSVDLLLLDRLAF